MKFIYSFTPRAQFVVLQDATVGSWLFALDAAVQEECSVGPGTAQQAEGCNGSGASLTKPRHFFLTPLSEEICPDYFISNDNIKDVC